ncbi:hypothetical protein [Loktanella sp. M215]|uniref:hypothetical protein n=1 Tax=Loktanella sp. M215 TaxID=2675431 RepID=UPI001F3F859B|nr:hypothetical protein [Loktanella sp. M215]MCF7700782.1 hypothetical protein [Loktanella sp. M215]
MTARRILPLVLLAVLAMASAATAQTRPAQFFLTGPIQSFTLDAGDLLTGGSMVVEGTTVTIPRNLIVQMPATFLTPKDIFDLNPGNPAESGLAINDSAPRPGDYQASIVGNIVGSRHVAGLVWISQDPLAEGAGYIKSIAANGEITLVADPTDAAPQPETRIRINDPDSVFAPQDPNLDSDPRFMVDGENPTIMSMSGYPMCIPRAANDPECPDANRPEDAGKPLSRFIMGPADLAIAPAGSPPLPKCPACMPEKQAPMRPGDYIIYAGTLARDGADIYISAHTIQANVGIYTQPGVAPAYIAIEGSLLGTMGPRILRDPAVPNDFIDQETQDRLRVEGATTDPTLGIDIYAIDVDPTGNESVRFLSSAPRKEPPYGRFNLVLGKNANALFDGNGVSRGAVREILVRLARNGRLPDGAPVPSGPTFANGLVAGQYRAPVGEFIFPENKSVGEQILPNNFECLPFLVTGTGNLTTNGHNGPDQVGQLDPWPGDPVPAAVPASIFCGP